MLSIVITDTSRRTVPGYFSFHSIENARYSIAAESKEMSSLPDHHNEDKCLFTQNSKDDLIIMAVFDGHDGIKGSLLAEAMLHSRFINPDVLDELKVNPKGTLNQQIFETESKFFEEISKFMKEKDDILSTLPKV